MTTIDPPLPDTRPSDDPDPLDLPGAEPPGGDFKLPRDDEPDPRLPGMDSDVKPDVEVPDSQI